MKVVEAIRRDINLAMLVFMTCFLLFSCTMEAEAAKAEIESGVKSRVARAIDSQLDEVIPQIIDDISTDIEDIDLLYQADGDYVVARAIEEGAMDYIVFSDNISRATTTEEILSAAKPVLPRDEYNELVENIEKEEAKARAIYDECSRAMTSAQQKAFYKDLKSMVVKAVVLMTAGLVYACIPSVMVWGKVSAACAVSVAAGIAASGILNVMEYYRYGKEFDSLDTWLKEVYSTTYGNWAFAATVIATGTAAKRSPVVTGLILVVYALYGVLENMKPLMSKYGFSLG
ncbi:MAG: hypothetical protein K6G51_05740 [Sphaerochaetaceae bacterium]|nr:hypothetical protein [Sphaerochaetaceae bacterium]